jgi:hypothetical protein
MWGTRFTFMAALESATEISTLSGAPQHALRGIYGTHKQFAIFCQIIFLILFWAFKNPVIWWDNSYWWHWSCYFSHEIDFLVPLNYLWSYYISYNKAPVGNDGYTKIEIYKDISVCPLIILRFDP